MPQFGGAPKCPVCDTSVYHAEEVRAVGKSFHKFCLKCASCSKVLDAVTMNDHEDKIYCRACYGKNFGPKGYGFASGGAGLSTEGSDKPTSPSGDTPHTPTAPNPLAARFGGGGDKCATCGTTVYHNERLDCAGSVFHKMCLKCKDCNKMLDKGSINEHQGAIFCRGCYTKSYGTKGFHQGTSMHVS